MDYLWVEFAGIDESIALDAVPEADAIPGCHFKPLHRGAAQIAPVEDGRALLGDGAFRKSAGRDLEPAVLAGERHVFALMHWAIKEGDDALLLVGKTGMSQRTSSSPSRARIATPL
jgi:hypothetical protein